MNRIIIIAGRQRFILWTVVGVLTALTTNVTLPLFPGVKRALGIAPCLPWHDNKGWKRLLSATEKNNQDKIPECYPQMIDATFGATRVYACAGDGGDDPQQHRTPIILHHASESTSNVWGKWMVTKLPQEDYYVILVDYLCTNGHSMPRDGDPRNCPSNEMEIAAWMEEIVTKGLNLKIPVAMMGASCGVVIPFLTALYKPEMVDQIVMIAPAGTLCEPVFLLKWTLHAAFPSPAACDWLHGTLIHNKTTTTNSGHFDSLDREQEMAKLDVMAPLYAVQPVRCPDPTLREAFEKHRTFVGMGDHEAFVGPDGNASAIVEHARECGVDKTLIHPKANHDMFFASPTKECVADDVVRFLKAQERRGAATTMASDVLESLVADVLESLEQVIGQQSMDSERFHPIVKVLFSLSVLSEGVHGLPE